MGATVTTASDITLITLQNCPNSISYLHSLLEQISAMSINIDMISLAPAYGASTSLSFTISDNDLGKILEFTSSLHEKGKVKTIVSGGNSKISIYDERMRNTPGMAAKVFEAAAKANTDIRIITTSEVEIALLVTSADFNETLAAIEEAAQNF